MPGRTPGTISVRGPRWNLDITVQCASCWVTASGYGIFALDAINFRAGPYEPGTLPYRRCPECRANHRYPQETT